MKCVDYLIVAGSIFLRSLTTENAAAGRDWPITTVAGENLSNQVKKTAALNRGRKLPGIHLQTTLQVINYLVFFSVRSTFLISINDNINKMC